MKTQRIPLYVSHPLGDPDETWAKFDNNRLEASRWCLWLAQNFYVSPVADWIVLSTPGLGCTRVLGLECDMVLAHWAQCVALCGPTLSPGMMLEANAAHRIVNLLGLDRERDIGTIAYLMLRAGFKRIEPETGGPDVP